MTTIILLLFIHTVCIIIPNYLHARNFFLMEFHYKFLGFGGRGGAKAMSDA